MPGRAWRAGAVLLLVLAVVTASTGFQVRRKAPPCDTDLCNDSKCRCSSTETPGDMKLTSVPQFIVLSFDGGVTVTNYPFYKSLKKYVNPNGCNIKMTMFVTHENTDYTLVNKLHRVGNEISTRSVSSVSDIDHYWRNMTEEMWQNEINDMKSILIKYGNIPGKDITGFRVPFLEVGGNLMYKVLSASGFTYDSSWPSLKYTTWYPDSTRAPGAMFPYTLDYKSIQDQTVGTPPTDSFPGLWVNPMTDMQDNRGEPCPMLDLCLSEEDELETSSEAVLDLLKRNFKSHYYVDRTPFGLYTRQAWFINDDLTNSTARTDGFYKFLEYVASFPDVYIVTVDQLIQWMKEPHSLEDLEDFKPLQCESDLPLDDCPEDNNIDCHYNDNLPIDQLEVYMKICQGPCPAAYPWTGNPDGTVPTKQ